MTIEERFWSKVDVRGEDECWLWTAGTVHGYGRFYVDATVTPEGQRVEHDVNAHRFSLELFLGRPLLPGMETNHTCREQLCVNPRHLFEDTHLVNSRINKKGVILTEEDVAAIRAMRTQTGWGKRKISRALHLPYGAIGNVLRGITWKEDSNSRLPLWV